MGSFTTVGMEEVERSFLKREQAATKAVPLMLEAGAKVIAEAQQREAAAMGINETAGFIQAIKPTPIKGSDTEKYIEVYPQGKAKHGNESKKDKSNVRYATIGFINQYGTSSQAARPYMTAANEKARTQVMEEMYKVWEGVNNG